MSIIHWPTFFYTFVACGALLYLFITVRLISKEKNPSRDITHDQLRKRARTGDIVGVAYGSTRAKIVKVFTGSRWTHCAFIMRSGDHVNIVEIARYSDEKSGVIVTPLDEWLNKHKRCVLIYRPLEVDSNINVKNSEALLERPQEFIDAHFNAKPDLNLLHWLKTMCRVSYHRTTPKSRYYCSEFVMRFFQCVEVVEKKYDPASYKPWEVVYGKLHWMPGYNHGLPLLINPFDDYASYRDNAEC